MLLFVVLLPNWAGAQQIEALPQELRDVAIQERLGSSLPMQTVFQNSRGQRTRLAEIFEAGKPVIVTMNYAECPMLCKLQLQGVVDALRGIDWDVGSQFEVVTISIDPNERPEQSAKIKQRYLRQYGRAGTANGWHFLTGDDAAIRTLTDAAGFGFKYVKARREYAHAAVILVCTPDGTISRYLYGVQFPSRTLRLSLVEASNGEIGTTVDRFLLYCLQYDAEAGRYGPVARRIMKIAAGITLLAIAAFVVPYWLKRRRKAEDSQMQELGEETAVV